jgi:signal peptidase I
MKQVMHGALRERILRRIGRTAPDAGDGGILFVRFQGTSMLPGLREGDVLAAAPLEGSMPRKGEIVLRARDEQVLEAHRVVAVRGDRLVTRGDSRPFRDRPWFAARCRGRVVAVWRGNGLYEPPGRPSAWVRGRTLAGMGVRALWRRLFGGGM